MKLKQIAILVAGLATAGQVYAQTTPVTLAQAQAATQVAWISGASAPTLSVYEGWVGSGAGVGCNPGTNAIFTTAGGTAVKPGTLGNFTAYACTRGTGANEKVSVLYHTVDGGSLNAYTPHTIGTKLGRLSLASGCTASATNYVDATNADNNAVVYRSCALSAAGVTPATEPKLPVGGFSDVEAALFPSSIGGGDVSAKGVESAAQVGQVFGLAVSLPLYTALQAAQGIVDDGTPNTAPNITSAQYTSIIAQGGGYQSDWSPILAAGAGKKVILARRVATSGTQASSNAFFLANPCAAGALGNLNPATAADSTSSFEVFEGSGTGNVKTRITTAANAGGINNFAIGVISAENDWRTDSSTQNGWRFVKLNGVHPEAGDVANARVTATNGNYPFHMEMRNFVRSNYAGVAAKTAFENAIVGQITSALANPPASSCAVLPRGLTLNPLGGSSCTVGTQVAKGTNLGNNCSPMQLTQ